MKYDITIEGKVRHRLYINLILFKIARGWRESPFRFKEIISVPGDSQVALGSGFMLNVLVRETAVRFRITHVSGLLDIDKAFPVSTSYQQPFFVRAWKGVEITGYAIATAVPETAI